MSRGLKRRVSRMERRRGGYRPDLTPEQEAQAKQYLEEQEEMWAALPPKEGKQMKESLDRILELMDIVNRRSGVRGMGIGYDDERVRRYLEPEDFEEWLQL